MDTDEVWRHVAAERSSLADLLEELTDAEWETPSLCPGWTVRNVAVHVISSPQARLLPVLAGMARARGDFNRFVFTEALRASSAVSPEEIVAQYRQFAGSRRHPPGTTPLDPLLDVLIHGQDIAVPLGRRREMPPGPARVAADRIWQRSMPFRARKRLAGLRLVATDIDWAVGEGAEVRGPIEALLLLLSGRSLRLPQLAGPGAAQLPR